MPKARKVKQLLSLTGLLSNVKLPAAAAPGSRQSSGKRYPRTGWMCVKHQCENKMQGDQLPYLMDSGVLNVNSPNSSSAAGLMMMFYWFPKNAVMKVLL